MSDFQSTTVVATTPDALFDYLADIANLPEYFPSITSAEPGDGEAVQVTAVVYDNEVAGEAWFRVDRDANTLAWGSKGPNDYSGELDVAAEGDGSRVTVRLRTQRGKDSDVQGGLDETVATIKRLVEEGTGHS